MFYCFRLSKESHSFDNFQGFGIQIALDKDGIVGLLTSLGFHGLGLKLANRANNGKWVKFRISNMKPLKTFQ